MTPVTKAFVEKIKRLPSTQVQDSSTANGLGSIVIYETTPNGIKTRSIWLGRPSTEDQLVNYLAERRLAITEATGRAA